MKKLASKLLEHGFKHRMSDLYISPIKRGYKISYRYHLSTTKYMTLKTKEAEQLILYFKYLGGMDIAEKRKSQMGGASVKSGKISYRLRLSSVSDFLNRETLVIRFLYPLSAEEKLSFINEEQFEVLLNSLSRKGLFIFSGPTGSGKSTTMHALIKYSHLCQNKQIISIEDPVEIEDPTCIQLQVNEKIGLTYQELIKVCLRHRPDILIIGEIRDQETAKMAVRAALTGHLVFTTIHANDKEGVYIRLKELEVNTSELLGSVSGVVYQEMLPLKKTGEYGVLYDMSFYQEEDQWEKSLQEAYKKEKITYATYAEYQEKRS